MIKEFMNKLVYKNHSNALKAKMNEIYELITTDKHEQNDVNTVSQ